MEMKYPWIGPAMFLQELHLYDHPRNGGRTVDTQAQSSSRKALEFRSPHEIFYDKSHGALAS